MADSSDDRTEEPTSRRLSDARKEGQIARSTELPAAAVTIAAIGIIFLAVVISFLNSLKTLHLDSTLIAS